MMNWIRTLLLMGFAAAGGYVYGDWEGRQQPIQVQAARAAYWNKISDGPMRDRLLVAVDKLQQEVDRQDKLIREYQAGR